MTTRTIDPKVAAFQQHVQEDWGTDAAAAVWQKFFKPMREQLASVTAELVKAAHPQPGLKILDLAAGPGEPSLSLAQAVGPEGSVTATDFNPAMLAALRFNAASEGIANITTQVCDAHALPFPDNAFDRVVSRFGVMFFAETGVALSQMRRVLRPGGLLALLVWGPPSPGTYFGVSVKPYVQRMAGPQDPDGPAPMRFAESGKLARLVDAAGFADVTETSHRLPALYRGTSQQLLADLMEIATPFRIAVEAMPEAARAEAKAEALSLMDDISKDGVIHLAAPVIIVTGSA